MILNDFGCQSHCWRTCEGVDPFQVTEPMRCKVMNFGRFICRFLAIFVIAGLVSQPLVTPAGAKQRPVAEMTGMSAMSADMPCCPDEQKKNDCQECPLPMCALMMSLAGPF